VSGKAQGRRACSAREILRDDRSGAGTAAMRSLVATLLLAPACYIVPASSPPPQSPPPPPPGNATPARGPIEPQLVGCWDWYNYKDAQTGDESYRGKLHLGSDASFSWDAHPWGSSEDKGLPELRDQGQWGVADGVLQLFGAAYVQYTLDYQGSSPYFNGIKQFTCR
jgi:hypothetical protein